MSWKNVLRLYGVYRKSYRLVRKGAFRRYREQRWITYAIYALLLLSGAVIGGLIALGIGALWSVSDPAAQGSVRDAAAAVFVALPVFAILYSLYFTMMSQVQRMGARVSVQPIYWFPLTWEEHTLASILTSLATPLSLTLILIPIVLIPAAVIGMVPLGALAIAAVLLGMTMTSATSEILKGVQVRLVEAVSRRAGRATVWLRFLATLAFFTVVYVSYFALNSSNAIGMVQSLAGGITMGWFIPYLWPGIALYEVYRGAWPAAAALAAASAVFIYALYRVAVSANARSALRETAAIRISHGSYAPKRGLLERLGISAATAAIMRKDLRAYTRRQELMYVFILPIVFIVSTLMPLLGVGGSHGSPGIGTGMGRWTFFYVSLQPALIFVVFLATSIVGAEGAQRWFLFMSPLPPRGFVRAKYLFCTLICGAVALATIAVAALLYAPSTLALATDVAEALLLVFSIGMVALAFGIAGADFREAPRRRTVQPLWLLACVPVCMALALIVALPVLIYGIAGLLAGVVPGLPSPLPSEYLFVALLISGLLALATGAAGYVACIRLAKGLYEKTDA